MRVRVLIPHHTSLQKRAAKLEVSIRVGELKGPIDPESHTIVAHPMTDSNVHDGDAVAPLLEKVEPQVRTFYGDGAYDQRKVRDNLKGKGIDLPC